MSLISQGSGGGVGIEAGLFTRCPRGPVHHTSNDLAQYEIACHVLETPAGYW